MSKSYQNAIDLSDSEESIKKKVKSMFTDPKRLKLTDPGHPEKCNVFSYFEVFAAEKNADVRQWCENAEKGCTDCKMILADVLIDHLRPIREKRRERDRPRVPRADPWRCAPRDPRDRL